MMDSDEAWKPNIINSNDLCIQILSIPDHQLTTLLFGQAHLLTFSQSSVIGLKNHLNEELIFFEVHNTIG